MDNEGENVAPILEVAWNRYAQFDAVANRLSRQYYRLRRWILWFGIFVPYFAIITTQFFSDTNTLPGLIFRIFSNLLPATAAVLAVFATRIQSNEDRLIWRSAAEEISREIYIYRTILSSPNSRDTRHKFLRARLAKILQQVSRSLKGEFSFETYTGPIPPYSHPTDQDRDSGYTDLNGDQYFKFRVVEQVRWHNYKVNQYKLERRRLTFYILAAGLLGSILAGLGGVFSVGVTITVSITMAFISWWEVRNLDTVIRNYSKVVTDLTLLEDHWNNLEIEERTDMEFHRMVRQCEDILWRQNGEYIQSMQEALMHSDLQSEALLIANVIQKSVETERQLSND